MFRPAILSLGALAFLGACAQQPGQGGLDRNVGIGAALGAAIGGGLGTLAGGDDRRNALIGAGIGALAGAAVGDYLNRQQAQLEQDLAGTGATIVNTGDQLLVNLPAGVTFDFDSAAVRPEFIPALNDVANTLRQFQQSYVDVVGHTDNVGSAAYNQTLSERRAQSVANVLTNRGVQPQRIITSGMGFNQPVASNDTPEGRARNRRVELRITPLT
ncbi:MAG: OmpA family protein [Rhodobacteraceae bacterium]|nr:MAG: OmpA family protein [Paracoccaceae bacterium]